MLALTLSLWLWDMLALTLSLWLWDTLALSLALWDKLTLSLWLWDTLAQNCDYVVLDEPTTYLDLNAQQSFMDMLLQLKEQGKTIILVLHDIGQALRISDTLVIMQDRKIAAIATPEACLQQHIIEAVFDVHIKKFSDEEGNYYFFS